MDNQVTKTAYYPLGVRAWDAQQGEPVCNDWLAPSLMTDEAKEIWKQFASLNRPNFSTAGRHAIIDDLIRKALQKDSKAKVVVMGAGFDTRAFRLSGGNWLEVDEPAILAEKERHLPSHQSPNSLVRIPIDFAKESLKDHLSSFSQPETTHVILEGVLMYLTQRQRWELLETLGELFPHHFIYCDLVKRSFFQRQMTAVHEQIVKLGASFKELQEKPEQLFLQAGYQPITRQSVVGKVADQLEVPRWILHLFLRNIKNGFCVWQFERFPN
ncbi:class I SAM-dependent methyltransferase [Euhalothece natronophila Z-M001]|uniref:Class I SAM-dependent methyltransferase n=1 Tax=Euhalothece natronophila Z-M001 TaxID=522448 RepID=A0A5B8NMR6_9CHRO|nr:class I SAM-dependent methyltransferase [Euhalothece natronophila]QDZ39831.1 class I SAM-dependent methyltransferase [Euhalothece natronophila Z-M001]